MSSYLHIFISSNFHIFISSYLHLHIFIFISSHRHIFISLYLHVFISSYLHLHIFIFISSYFHIFIFISSCLHLQIFTFISSYLHVFISSYHVKPSVSPTTSSKITMFGRGRSFCQKKSPYNLKVIKLTKLRVCQNYFKTHTQLGRLYLYMNQPEFRLYLG